MEEEINTSINLLKVQKKIIIKNTKNNKNENDIIPLKKLEEIDRLLETYYFKLSNSKFIIYNKNKYIL